MLILLRQIVFLFIATIMRWPLWLLIGIIGRFGVFKTVFLVYPTDEVESRCFCPNIALVRRYLLGRPTPAGLILDGWRPMGIYFVTPDVPMDLARKKNRKQVEIIVRRMRWIRRLAGAKTIGLAGQLGPIFSRRHNIPMEPPLFDSIKGNVFSIHEAVSWVADRKLSCLHNQKITVIGGGELGITLQEYLTGQGYQCNTVSVRYTRRGEIIPIKSQQNVENLQDARFVVNLLPKGTDFLNAKLQEFIPPTATIIDFSRPAIAPDALPQTVYAGNKLRRFNMRFVFALPGGWTQQQLPACALPAILAALTGESHDQLEPFCQLARQQAFSTALVDTPEVHAVPVRRQLASMAYDLSLGA